MTFAAVRRTNNIVTALRDMRGSRFSLPCPRSLFRSAIAADRALSSTPDFNGAICECFRFRRLARFDQYQPGASGPQAPPQSFAASAFSMDVVSCICAMLLAARNCWYC